MARDWLAGEAREDKIELFHTPYPSPEPNPDERLNSGLKGQFRAGPLALTREEVKRKVRSGMGIIPQNPARVKKYFLDLNIDYAA